MKLTVSEAADRAGVCPTIVYGWVAARLIPHYRIGAKGTRGRIVIDEADLAAYLESCRVEPASVPRPKPSKSRETRAASTDRGVRFVNLNRAVELPEGTGWRAVVPDHAFRSGILLLQAERPAVRQADPAALRAAFHDRGLVLTAYEDGVVRLSMPDVAWQCAEVDSLRTALLAFA